ncbi:flightin isoform X1 [Condylostylus longicornis]|uniref:flightin isoform X1 n=1 Tax=Condylostylus longicornis TaxID=2530218 RepID=UPI00244DD0A0|nr:flightin isoform X1 [Condylostylus longicornis]
MADEEPASSPAKSGSKPGSKAQTPTAGSKTGSKAGTPAAGSKVGTPTGGSKAESVAPEEAAPPPPPQEEKRPIRYYRHWVRPQFLQYKYMYQYRHNYYNDVIDYLDKRDKGINRPVPKAQTWAERVLRTNAERRYVYFDQPPQVVANPKYWGPSIPSSGRLSPIDDYHPKGEPHLIITLPAVIKAHNYHTKSYINQRYQRVL